MTLIDILRVVFYLWLAVALGVWIYRGYRAIVRRGAARSGDIDPTDTSAAGGAAPGDESGQLDSAATPDRPIPSRIDAPKRTFRSVLDERDQAKKPVEHEDGSLVASVIRDEIAARGRAAANSGVGKIDADDEGDATEAKADKSRRGLFAPTTGDGTSGDTSTRPIKPVSELLKGIVMPCDLAPLISADAVLEPFHVSFVTTGVAAATVGSMLGDELERLDYGLISESDTEVVATRGDDVLRVTLHPDAATARHDGERLFPAVPGGSVVVEFRS